MSKFDNIRFTTESANSIMDNDMTKNNQSSFGDNTDIGYFGIPNSEQDTPQSPQHVDNIGFNFDNNQQGDDNFGFNFDNNQQGDDNFGFNFDNNQQTDIQEPSPQIVQDGTSLAHVDNQNFSAHEPQGDDNFGFNFDNNQQTDIQEPSPQIVQDGTSLAHVDNQNFSALEIHEPQGDDNFGFNFDNNQQTDIQEPSHHSGWDSSSTPNNYSTPAPQNNEYRLKHQILDITAFDNKDSNSEIKYLNVAFNIKYGNLRFSLFGANDSNKTRKTTINLNYRNILLLIKFIESGNKGIFDLIEPIHNQDNFDVMDTYRPNKTKIIFNDSPIVMLNTEDMGHNNFQFAFDKVDISILLSTLKFGLNEGLVLAGQYLISNEIK